MDRGLLAEFDTPESMLRAIEELRARGYEQLDAFTPYPVHGLEKALGLRRSPITWMVLPFAIAGAVLAYFIQWYCNAYDYPLDVGGRPLNAVPAFIPITFETTVLISALAGFVLFLVLTRLPQLWSPIFDVPGFETASIDRFWIGIDARDPALVRSLAERDLASLGALTIAWFGTEAAREQGMA